MNTTTRDALLERLRPLATDPKACIHGTPMVPVYQTTLQEIVAALSAQPAASAELLDDTSLRAAIGGIGNEVHNLACEHQNSDEFSRRLSDIAGRLWALAQQCSAEPTAASVQGASDHSALLAELDEFVHGLDFMGTGGIETEKATEEEWQVLLARVTSALNAAPEAES